MSWLNGVIGQGIATNLGGTGHMAQQNAAQATQYGLLQNAAQQNAMAQQAAQNVQQGLGIMSAGSYQGISQPMRWNPTLRWMVDGVMLEFKDFVDIVFPEDTPDKTMFVLKYSKGEEK
jgi:hypothetical protein